MIAAPASLHPLDGSRAAEREGATDPLGPRQAYGHPPASRLAEALVRRLPRAGRVLVDGAAAASELLIDAVLQAGDELGALTFTGIQVPGVNRRPWIPNPRSKFETFFMTPQLAAAGGRVDFLPFSYMEIARHLVSSPCDVALFSVSPPDANGMCSFGPTVDFLADLWPSIPVRIAHVNPLIPRTSGSTGIPIKSFHPVADEPAPLFELPGARADRALERIGSNIAALVRDGSTIQTGLGEIPGAALGALLHHRNLHIHSGLIGDGVLDLLAQGAIAHGEHIIAGVAMGTRRLYDALTVSGISFHPVSFTHNARRIASIPNFTCINSAGRIDLFGQAYSERGERGWSSGTGGVTDFARAAGGGGLRIVALRATRGALSRIVPPSAGAGPVTLSRTETDVVVTEHGVADLRGTTHDQRASALIAIAAPEHRDGLARSWFDGPYAAR